MTTGFLKFCINKIYDIITKSIIKRGVIMKKFTTLAIHGEDKKTNPDNSLNDPIYMTSTFTFDKIEDAERAFSFASDDYVYTRGNNPGLIRLEEIMTLLEKGADSVAFSSGMAAISSTLFSLLKPGDALIAHPVLYGSSYNVINKILPDYGIDTKFIDLRNFDKIEKEITGKTKLIYFETPSNPDLGLIDIKKISKLTHSNNIKIVVDNTFATPFFQRPLQLGADIVVHSATKYLSGHGDVLGGVVVSKDEDYIHKLKFNYMTEFGGVLSPFNAWLILRGIKTLKIRMKEHEKNAINVASFLNKHKRVNNIRYPGLENDVYHELAQKQMSGYGAIISFDYNGSKDEAINFINSLNMIKIAVSLGDVETLIEYPFAMTHRDYTEEKLREIGLSKYLIRLSIGLEDYTDIIKDLEQALE